jgi:hypothetical protein
LSDLTDIVGVGGFDEKMIVLGENFQHYLVAHKREETSRSMRRKPAPTVGAEKVFTHTFFGLYGSVWAGLC